jgi:PAS domain S-box-containing protein
MKEIIQMDWRIDKSDEPDSIAEGDAKKYSRNINFYVKNITNIMRKNGEHINVEMNSKPIQLKGYHLIVVTIKEAPAPQDDSIPIENDCKLYSSLVNYLPNAIVVRSGDEIIYVNNAAVELFGAGTKENIIGRMPKEFLEIDEEFNKNVLNGNRMKHSYGQINAYEQSMVRICDGKLLDLELMATTIPYDSKMVSLVFAKDISERKRTEQFKHTIAQQQFMLDKAHEYDQLRTEFFANVSHDLRTPLNVMLSSLQMLNLMLKENSFIERKDKFVSYADIMTQNSKRMLKIINNIIDIARIDSGFMQLYMHNYNIVEVIEDITLMVVEYARNKGVTIQFDTEIEELMMACDKEKIERVMLNLLSNAVKYTNKGGKALVYISTNINGDKVYISVKDNGIGISKEKHDWIFQRFAQEDNSLTRMDEGSGIGLSIVKSLVEMHKGNVTLISQPGKGSEFIIELPVNLVDEDEEQISHSIDDKINETRVDVEFSDVI